MDWADDVTYAVHDVEDFYRAGLIPLDKLILDDEEGEKFLSWVFARWRSQRRGLVFTRDEYKTIFESLVRGMPLTETYRGTRGQRASLRTVTATLIARYITGFSLMEPGKTMGRVRIADWARVETDLLKELVWFYVITNPSLATQQYGQRRVIRELFEIFMESAETGNFDIFPTRYQEHVAESVARLTGVELRHAHVRTVVDLIAAMTEAETVAVHERLTGRNFGSISDALVR